MIPTDSRVLLVKISPSFHRVSLSRVPAQPHRNLVFFLHRRSRPKHAHSEYTASDFHPWNRWRETDDVAHHWLSSFTRSYKDLDPKWTRAHLNWWRIARVKEDYLHRVVRATTPYHWHHEWDQATRKANRIHAILLKGLREMNHRYAQEQELKVDNPTKTPTTADTKARTSDTHATMKSVDEGTEIDLITLKRVPRVSANTYIDQMLNGNSGKPSHGGANSGHAANMSTTEFNLDVLENNTASFDADIPSTVVETSGPIPQLESDKNTTTPINCESNVKIQAIPGNDGTANSTLAATGDSGPELQPNVNLNPNETTIIELGAPILEASTARPDLESATGLSYDSDVISNSPPKLSPADLIASLRYYDRKRGLLPDEEPLSAEDIALLESSKIKATASKETTIPRSKFPAEDDRVRLEWMSKVKRVVFALSSIVAGAYIIGIGNKLLFVQPESTAAAEMLSAVRRSREKKPE
ncbi:hypothetical protein AA313_de0207517 [Arthrobotrys entomopaga]|nr:hypothetical protein AA313_de0207517 [Arthrobotrys entomopaga]